MKLKRCEWLRSMRLVLVLSGGGVVAAACGEGTIAPGAATGGRGVTNSGGTGDEGGTSGKEGGRTSNPETGGASGSNTGGVPNQAGASSGGEATGGDVSTGAEANGGEIATGGEATGGEATGGDTPTGGTTDATGGTTGGTTGGSGGTTGGSGGTTGGSGGTTGGSGGTTGGAGGTTGGSGGTTGGAGGTTGGTTGACIELDDDYVDLFDNGGIRGHAWAYHWREGLSATLGLTSGRLSLPYTIPGDTYDEAFMIGFNLNQGHVTSNDPVWAHDTGDEVGICIWGSGFDRIQVDDGQDNYYCVETTGCVEWGDFREECWDSSPGSVLPNNALVYNAAAMQPARSDTEHTGTICITSMYFWDGT